MSAITLKDDPDMDEDGVSYPSADGQPMAETGIHVLAMVALISVLRGFFRQQSDVYVIGNIFLYYDEGNPKARRSPDLMVVKGVQPGERRSFKTWKEKAVPCFIVELTSAKTVDVDLGAKKDLYERLGVKEYFLFDPLEQELPDPLVGYRLVDGKYEFLVPAGDGGMVSEELGLRLVPEGTYLILFDLASGKRLLTLEEAYRRQEQLEADLAALKAELAQRNGSGQPPANP